MEGTLEGLPAMAVSSACFQWREFQAAADLAVHVAEAALADQWPENLLLNLNVPPCKQEAMGELRWTRLSIRRYDEQFSPRVDPRGRTYYWLAGEAVEDFESGGDGPRDWPTDVAQIKANAPSLTPIQPELFWRGGLSSLPQLRLHR
jgi:5'-nucleotidase